MCCKAHSSSVGTFHVASGQEGRGVTLGGVGGWGGKDIPREDGYISNIKEGAKGFDSFLISSLFR